ncbi:MAG: phage holin family protein [Limnochordaceae bacterium]|nr:phage holin family protein [Limnochordaceae bacterium]
MDWIRAVVRFVVSAVVLMFVGAIVPGFRTLGFWNALLAALVIAGLGWLVEVFLGRNVSPYGRGIVGFIVSAVVIWAAQFVVPGMSVTILGALLAALIIGVVDMFVPTALR